MARKIHLLPRQYKAVVRHRPVEDWHAALVAELNLARGEIKRLESLIKFKDGVLVYAAEFLAGVLQSNKPQSIERIKRLVSQLRGAADREQGGFPE